MLFFHNAYDRCITWQGSRLLYLPSKDFDSGTWKVTRWGDSCWHCRHPLLKCPLFAPGLLDSLVHAFSKEQGHAFTGHAVGNAVSLNGMARVMCRLLWAACLVDRRPHDFWQDALLGGRHRQFKFSRIVSVCQHDVSSCGGCPAG